MASKRKKLCDIPRHVRETVYERDGGCCVICGRPGIPNAHYIPRSLGGLGIEENVVTLCTCCHNAYDNGYSRDTNLREYLGGQIKAYLASQYHDWDEKRLYYDRWGVDK